MVPSREKTIVCGKFHAPDNKMVIKSHPAPDSSQRGCLWWRGFPNTDAAAFQVVRFPVLQGSSGYRLCGLLLGQFLNSQALEKLSVVPPRRLAASLQARIQGGHTKWDSPSALGWFSPGKANSWGGHFRGWQCPSKG